MLCSRVIRGSLLRSRTSVPFLQSWPRCRAFLHNASEVLSTPPRPISNENILEYVEDSYGGVEIKPEMLPRNEHLFQEMLENSLQLWRSQGKRGVWLKVPIDRANLVGVAVNSGRFLPHHAEETHIMLVKWLPRSDSHLPPNASHQVGVGAVVINERSDILVVMERHGPLKGKSFWKIPTGLVHAGEDLHEAVEREVLEETGVRAKFDCVLSVRQAHGFAFSKSDLFFTMGLKPLEQPDVMEPQESEIEAVRWLPLQAFVEQQLSKGSSVYDKMKERYMAYAEGRYHGIKLQKLAADADARRAALLMYGEDDHNEHNGGAAPRA